MTENCMYIEKIDNWVQGRGTFTESKKLSIYYAKRAVVRSVALEAYKIMPEYTRAYVRVDIFFDSNFEP